MQVRARSSVGYGNFSAPKEIELPPETGVSQPVQSDSGGTVTIAVPAVFATIGWVTVIAIIVAIISGLVWYKRHHSATKL
jgi:hypothetical protein